MISGACLPDVVSMVNERPRVCERVSFDRSRMVIVCSREGRIKKFGQRKSSELWVAPQPGLEPGTP